MMKHHDATTRLLVLVLCALFSGAACNKNDPSRDIQRAAHPSNDNAPTDPAALFPESAGKTHLGPSLLKNYAVVYATRPDPIPMNQPFTLYVAVYEPDGTRPLTDIDLTADAAMPQHQHGMNTQPSVTPHDTGLFVVRGMQFHMPGYWELYIDVTRNGITERAQFEVSLE